ncbi:transcription antitermination factor NusB [Solibaculum mannosilyticum]|uniref:Transcription antitermination protein NusB n=1 Tax=Solibaculum mannosilyticum TaxID=2780922 RepID=A0A7I8D189_9FIRM|nr:transcription antitermination factor NusB [Solibaculum mannosilyticum]BCI60506.1 N utilization substance protein B [Solibaculum mannosilyticum]
MMTRRQAREQAFILLFEKSFRPQEEGISDIIDEATEARQIEVAPYAVSAAEGACNHMDEIDQMIEKYSEKWDKKRLSRVVLSLLRLSCYEMLYVSDVPDGVSINEAVELAKQYGGDEDASFLNGILGAVSRRDKSPQPAE